MTDDQVRYAIFKAAMRDYYYESKDVMQAFFIPTNEQLQNETYDRVAVEINRDARDRAFEDFFKRIQGNIMKADGTPYPPDSEAKIADDFITGKGVIFRGTETDGFVFIKPENPTKMQRAFLDANNNSKHGDVPKNLAKDNHCSVAIKYDPTNPEVDPSFKPENMESEKPKKLGWWNKIVKAFTGHPCAAWKKYENYLKKEKIEAAKQVAEAAKQARELDGKKELGPEKVKEYQAKAIKDRNEKLTKEEARKLGEYKVDQLYKSMDELKEKFVIDEDTKSFKKVSSINSENRRKEIKKAKEAEKENEELIAKQKEEAEKKKEEDLHKETAQAKEKEQTKTLSQKRMEKLSAVFGSKEMEKVSKVQYGKIKDMFRDAYTTISQIGDPEAKPVTKEEIADAMTTICLTGEMLMEAKNGYSSYGGPEDNEQLFAAVAEDLISKDRAEDGIYNTVKEKFMATEEIEKLMTVEPDELDRLFFNHGMKNVEIQVKGSRELIGTDKIIDNQCDKNMQAHIAASKNAPEQTEYKGLNF